MTPRGPAAASAGGSRRLRAVVRSVHDADLSLCARERRSGAWNPNSSPCGQCPSLCPSLRSSTPTRSVVCSPVLTRIGGLAAARNRCCACGKCPHRLPAPLATTSVCACMCRPTRCGCMRVGVVHAGERAQEVGIQWGASFVARTNRVCVCVCVCVCVRAFVRACVRMRIFLLSTQVRRDGVEPVTCPSAVCIVARMRQNLTSKAPPCNARSCDGACVLFLRACARSCSFSLVLHRRAHLGRGNSTGNPSASGPSSYAG